jgi:hypothetical protein
MKDSTIITRITTPAQLLAWRGVVGIGGLTLTAGIAVFPQFYYQYYGGSELQTKVRAKMRKQFQTELLGGGFAQMSKGLREEKVVHEVDTKARVSFWLAFDITPQQQCILEDLFMRFEFPNFDEARLEINLNLFLQDTYHHLCNQSL